jgi:hypothetical protein
MKFDINKLNLKNVSNNIYQIYYDNSSLKFWTPNILAPFGIDTEYGKKILRLELDTTNNNKDLNKHIHLKKVILYIEKLIKDKLNVNNEEFKSIIKKRLNKEDVIECRLKMFKDRIITNIEYENKDNNYLKTIYDLEKMSIIKAEIEIYGLWDYRTPNKIEKNKVGLTVFINKIIVCK